jgi:hypothetical protein
MTAFTLVRSGVFGAAAVAAPAAVLFLASGLAWSSDLSGLVAYAAVLAIALAVVAALAWACVRFAELGPTTAVILTTMPFIALTVVTLPISLAVAPHLGLAAVIPVLFCSVGGCGAGRACGHPSCIALKRNPIAPNHTLDQTADRIQRNG